jgi:hypothetical protein
MRLKLSPALAALLLATPALAPDRNGFRAADMAGWWYRFDP